MAYSIRGHISYILETNSKRLLRKEIRDRSSAEEIEWDDFISFLTTALRCAPFSKTHRKKCTCVVMIRIIITIAN